ncbi:MAG: CoA-binding protein, partial [Thermoproteus sp.]
KAYRSILEVPEPIDVVQVFRPSEEVPKIAEEAVKRRRERGDVKVVWLQLGIRAPPGVREALEAEGIALFEDMCMMETHAKLFGLTSGAGGGMSERTRGMLKSFGVAVTTYEENMLKLIEAAGSRDPAEVLAEALRLNAEISRRLAEMAKYVEELEARLTEELLGKLRAR